jgi:hypothetical protein
MSALYRVAWRDVTTGLEGQGELLTYDLAKSWVKYGNEMYGRDWRLRREWRRKMIGQNNKDDGVIIEHWLESDTKSFDNTEHSGEENTTP